MKNLLSLVLTIIISLISVNSFAQKNKQNFMQYDISMYPKPKEDFKQVVIKLPIEKNEDNLKVELFIGKEMMVDCNFHSIVGEIKEENLESWGYTYFNVASNGNVISTKMGCFKPPTKKLVSINSILIRYNSKLPIIIYLEKSMEVNYRLWKADVGTKKAN